ncbi:MAG: hypothetical protein U0U67_09910 [Chitinophagales bacterium]
MKNAIFLFSIIALFVSVSCKKRGTTPDNPNVNSSILDSSVGTPTSSGSREVLIDVDKDGNSDFSLRAVNDNGNLITSLAGGRSNTPINFVVDDENIGYAFGENAILDSSVGLPKPPRPHLNYYYSGLISKITPSANLGHAGEGDIFIAFTITISGGRHFGWLKLNVSADGKTIKLKALGYNIKPEESLKAGEI